MTVLSSADTKNVGEHSTPLSLHLWRNFKKIKEQNRKQEINDQKSLKITLNEGIPAEIDNLNASSSNTFNELTQTLAQTSKRSIIQEQLFRSQCESQYRNISCKSSSSNSVFSENDKNMNTNGILHLKKPLSANPDNAKKYYGDRGRMLTIDWKSAEISCINQKKSAIVMNKTETSKETIASKPASKPKVLDEFSNFIENSVSDKTAYSKQANVKKSLNTFDNPIFKIQQLINRKKPLETIQIPASVGIPLTLKSSLDYHFLNEIDIFQVIDPLVNEISRAAETAKQTRTGSNERMPVKIIPQSIDQYNNYNKQAQNQISPSKMHLREDYEYFDAVGSKNVEEGNLVQNVHCKSKVNGEMEIRSHCPNLDFDDCDIVTYVNSLTHEESTAKRESRRRGMTYEDDLFAFVHDPPESSHHTSNLSVQSARAMNPRIFPFDRVKAACREKVKSDEALDSDDTFNISSGLESLSVSKVSMRVKYEALRKKMNKITPSCDKSESICKLPDDSDNSKILENKNQLLNRCLRSSHDYLKVHENNVVEITEVKLGLKPKPLLKPISTRYFEKPSTDQKLLTKEDKGIEKGENLSLTVESNLKTELLDCSSGGNLAKGKKEHGNVESNVVTEKKEHCSIVTKHEDITEPDTYDGFDIENAHLMFTNLFGSEMMNSDSGISILNKDQNSREMPLMKHNFEISNNSSSAIKSMSSVVNSDSENSSSSSLLFNNNRNIFENVNIELSELHTNGFDFDGYQTKDTKVYSGEASLNNERLQLDHRSCDSIVSSTSKQMSFNEQVQLDHSSENLKVNLVLQEELHNQRNVVKEKAEQNLNDNNDVSWGRCVEQLKFRKKNVATTTKFNSKKMKKYRIALENLKHKYNSAADRNEEDRKVWQSDNESQHENSHFQDILPQRTILKEIQKQRLHLDLRQFV